MGWGTIVAGLIKAFNLIAGWARDEGLKRQGAKEAEQETLKRQQSIRRKADDIDSAPVPDRDGDILKRL